MATKKKAAMPAKKPTKPLKKAAGKLPMKGMKGMKDKDMDGM